MVRMQMVDDDNIQCGKNWELPSKKERKKEKKKDKMKKRIRYEKEFSKEDF